MTAPGPLAVCYWLQPDIVEPEGQAWSLHEMWPVWHIWTLKNTPSRTVKYLLVSIVVSIPACHAGDRGSIPRRGALFKDDIAQAIKTPLNFTKLTRVHRFCCIFVVQLTSPIYYSSYSISSYLFWNLWLFSAPWTIFNLFFSNFAVKVRVEKSSKESS